MRQDPRTLSACILDYYDTVGPRYSPATWKAHVSRIEHMRGWLAREVGPDILVTDVDDRAMTRYYNWLRPPHYAASSYNNARTYGKQFWTFAQGEGWTTANPMRHVDPARLPKRVRLILSPDELLALLDGATPRDRVALALGMNTALRAGDIAALTVGSVNLGSNTLHAWIEKTDQEEILPITSELHTEIVRWLRHYAAAMRVPYAEIPNGWTLTPPMQYQAVNVWKPQLGGISTYCTGRRYRHPETIVQRALARLGHETKGEGFHTLRRSAARALFDLAAADGVGDPIRIPQALLGHKNRSTTEGYLGITHEKRLRDSMMRGRSFLGKAVERQRAALDSEGGERSA